MRYMALWRNGYSVGLAMNYFLAYIFTYYGLYLISIHCTLLYRAHSSYLFTNARVENLGPVHTSNNVEATFDFVEATFGFVATNGNNVERFYCKISSFRQSRNKLNMFLFRHCRKNR